MEIFTQDSASFSVSLTISPNTLHHQQDGLGDICRGSVTVDKFERLTRYGQYTVCADRGLDPALCICDMTSSSKQTTAGNMQPSHQKSELLSVSKMISNSKKFIPENIYLSVNQLLCGGDCLYIFIHQHRSGALLSLVNACSTQMFAVAVTVVNKSDVRIIYHKVEELKFVLPGGVVSLALVLGSDESSYFDERSPMVQVSSCQRTSVRGTNVKEFIIALTLL